MPSNEGFTLALDQGTTSSRAIIFDQQMKPVAVSQQELPQHYPASGWVEHDPNDIVNTTIATARAVLKSAGLKAEHITGIGITNQRETTIIWDRATGIPISRALVWQDRRTTEYCRQLQSSGYEDMVNAKTGLLLDPYFSASKISYLLDTIDGAREKAARGDLAFGTVDTWLIWTLTGGRVHATDATNASRTMLYNIHDGCWDDDLLNLFRIPRSILPDVKNSMDDYGHTETQFFDGMIPIYGVAGDQQSAAIGQACFNPGMMKSTYGTGCFALLNTGTTPIPSRQKLLTTIAYQFDGTPHYALEGSIFIAGAGVQWLRDKLKFINKASDTEKIVKSLKSNSGIYLVPAFTGLGAPYWSVNARGVLSGLTRDTGPKEITRATIESVAYQTYDLFEAMKNDGLKPKLIKVDGGMVQNSWFSQFLADIINTKVLRPKVNETTALGAAFMAGLQIGVYKSLNDIAKNWQADKSFNPKIHNSIRKKLIEGWSKAIKKTLS